MQYFLSYAVVKGSTTNSFGHAYLVLSELNSKDKWARPEVIHAFGQYGDPLEADEWVQKLIFPARLVGPGHLKNEHLRDIVIGGDYFHEHKTWQISASEKDNFLSSISHDMKQKIEPRDFRAEYSFWQKLKSLKADGSPESLQERRRMFAQEREQLKRHGGKHFNVVSQSCMTDAKTRLRAQGINPEQMEGYLVDIPSMTSGPLDALELAYDAKTGKVFWQSPLVVSPKQEFPQTEMRRQLFNRLRTFSILHKAVIEIEAQFDSKHNELRNQGKKVVPINQASIALSALKKELQLKAQHPNQISAHYNLSIERQLKSILQGCHRSLIKANADRPLVQFVRDIMDMFSMLVNHVSSFFAKQGLSLELSPFGFAAKTSHTLEGIHEAIRNQHVHRASLKVG